jgi:hypothetical protein
VRRFLESINALRVITLSTGDSVDCAQIRLLPLRKHDPRFKKLVIWLGMREAWNISHFEDLKKTAPWLEELYVPVEMHQAKKTCGKYTAIAREIMSQGPGLRGLRQDLSRPESWSAWPMKIQAIPNTFRHLRRLTRQIQLKHDSTQFVPDAQPGAECAINDDMARKTVMQMFNTPFLSEKPPRLPWTWST